MLHRKFGDLSNVIVSLFITETRETKRGLTTSSVLFGEIDGELVDYFTCVACEGAEECAITIHDDEPEFLIGFQKLGERFGVELVIAKIEGARYRFW
jgi:hypothetical protein